MNSANLTPLVETPSPPEPAEPAKPWLFAALSLFTFLGLGASTALLVDYLRPAPLFCSETGGCNVLRQTAFASIGGLPTPLYGVIGFLILGVLALLRGSVVRFLHLLAISFGACAATYLIYVQFVLHTYCKWCLTVDVSTLVLFGLTLWRQRIEVDFPRNLPAKLGVAAAFGVAVVAPFAANAAVKPKLPALIAQEMAKTPPGQVTVVDFVDFECPFCRQTNLDFAPTLAQYRGKYRLVRKQVPLSQIHPHALSAARAECCAEAMGKGDAMADELFAAPVDDLTDDGCVKMAGGLGLDAQKFRACMADPATQKSIDADKAAFHATQGHGLPTIWIGRYKIEGAQGPEVLGAAMAKAVQEAGG